MRPGPTLTALLLSVAAARAESVTTLPHASPRLGLPTLDNDFTGFRRPAALRGFFAFDLAGLSGPITSAHLELDAARFEGPDAFEVIRLHPVTTPIDTLLAGAGGVPASDDLGSGPVDATRAVVPLEAGTTLLIALDPAALDDLNAASGGWFAVGAALGSRGGRPQANAFGGSGGAPATRRHLNAGDAVPEPASLGLAALGALALACRARSRATPRPSDATPRAGAR